MERVCLQKILSNTLGDTNDSVLNDVVADVISHLSDGGFVFSHHDNEPGIEGLSPFWYKKQGTFAFFYSSPTLLSTAASSGSYPQDVEVSRTRCKLAYLSNINVNWGTAYQHFF